MVLGLFLNMPDTHAWVSLVGLLNPIEYLVTVDHSVLWQRHVAWSKPMGSDLRQYITQRYSSNQVFLSLMLGAELGVFFNSSEETSEMRRCLANESYGDLKYWIGLIVLLDACVTVVAIVTNFTLWGMISAISDTNTHCLLRSSIGQYIICVPPRFIVASLYLFLLWLLLWFIELLNGPMRIIVALSVIFLFFQVVIPLSAFGRLIIHTGAMAKRRVIDEDLEKDLLPSGLHASLLIRATDRRKKYTCAVHQYRKKAMAKVQRQHANDIQPRSSIDSNGPTRHTRNLSGNLDDDTEQQILATVNLLSGGSPSPRARPPQFPTQSKRTKSRHRRTESNDSAEFNFPRASILNSASSLALQDVVERTLTSVRDTEWDNDSSEGFHVHFADESSQIRGSALVGPLPSTPSRSEARKQLPNTAFPHPGNGPTSFVSTLDSLTPSPRARMRKSFLGFGGGAAVRRSSRRVAAEWEEEEAVRCDYDVSPPAELIEDTNITIDTLQSSNLQARRRVRASVLNQSWGLSALRELADNQAMDSPDTSDTESDNGQDGRHSNAASAASPMHQNRQQHSPERQEESEGETTTLLKSSSEFSPKYSS